MNWQEFEAQKRADAEQHTAPLDTEALWKAIEQRRKRRRRGWVWLWPALLAAGLSLAWGGYRMAYPTPNASATSGYFLKKNADATSSQPIASMPSASTTSGYFLEKNAAATSGQPAASMPNAGAASGYFLEKNAAATSGQPAASMPSAGAASGYFLKKNAAATSGQPAASMPSANATSGYFLKKNAAATSGQPIASMPSASTTSGYFLEKNAAATSGQPIASMPSASATSGYFLKKNADFERLDYCCQQVASQAHTPRIDSVIPQKTTESSDFEQKKDKKRAAAQLGAEFGYDRWATLRTNDQADPYRRQFEQDAEVLSATLRWRQPLARRWVLSAGVEYQQWRRTVRWDTTYVGPQERFAINRYPNGDIDTVWLGYASLYEATRRVQLGNELHVIGLPLELQRVFEWGRVRVAPSVGVVPQWCLRANGYTVGNAPNPLWRYDRWYQNRLGLSATVSCVVELSLWRQWSVALSPTFRTDLLRRTAPEADTERFRQAGLRLGLMWQLR
jgi:hypothetical protein